MVFSSLTFLFLFLPAVLVCYYMAPRRYRNTILLLFSYLFYLWGGGSFLFILIFSTIANYVLGLLLSHNRGRGNHTHLRWYIFISVAFNLSLLAYFKYSNFFVTEVNHLFSTLGMGHVEWGAVILPIGISFFTFHEISYIVDVYRHKREAFTSFVDYALYVAMFPQLIAGPIVRFHEISDQIKNRRETLDGFYDGVLRFCWGLSKKMILANQVAEISDSVFSMNTAVLDSGTAWLGVLAYTLQIYLDFSAYSDMAIGLGQMFGLRLPENFNRPYSAVSITDFWRRWHMTLSNFFRDYVYIPLGGNRLGSGRTYMNLAGVFVLCGLWHGANWTFLLWGIYHGGLLIFERVTGVRNAGGNLAAMRRFITIVLVMIGWVLFRARNVEQASAFLRAMFVPYGKVVPLIMPHVYNGRNLFFLLVAAIVLFLPGNFSGAGFFLKGRSPAALTLRFGVLSALVLYSVAFMASGSFNPFIYFQF